jgi:diaminopimelate decarboxylase
METLRFLNNDQVREIQRRFGTPVFVYDQASLEARAAEVMAFPNPYGLTARYAMKALPTGAILQVFVKAGLHIDASSGYEAERALMAGMPSDRVQITAQELPRNLADLMDQGVRFNACSLEQLRHFGDICPGRRVSVRINPGAGSGHSNRTNVGGPSSSFGIWHEYVDEVLAIAKRAKLKLARMHSHIGSGGDPAVWTRCADLTLGIAEKMPEVDSVNLGGGFKVGRMTGEPSAHLKEIGLQVVESFKMFEQRTGRKLQLEIEPGTYLVANAGALVAAITDVVDTGGDGYRFIKADAGMTELLRPSLYGAQHPIVVVPSEDEARGTGDYLVSGHCCESGDLLTPAPGNPEALQPRELCEPKIGDALVVDGAGAYCSSMASKHYNSFPEAAEVLLGKDGSMHLIRNRQRLTQIVENEMLLDEVP